MALLDFFRKKNNLKLDENDFLGLCVCPNCWGKQAYEGKFIDFVPDQEKDILNGDHTRQKAFVQKFIEQEVMGVRLKSDVDRMICPRCSKG